jgi:Tfp pilus assembly protein PilX
MPTKPAQLKPFALLKNSDGIIMPVVLVVTLLLMILGIGSLTSSSTDLLTTRMQREGKAAFYAAEGGLVFGAKSLNNLLALALVPTTAQLNAITAPSVQGFTFDTFTITANGSGTNVTISTGAYAGLNAFATPYTITAQASGTTLESGTVRLTQDLQDQLIPLFQFGVFYNGDLEIFPGPPMTFNGRIHSNKHIYIGGAATVDSRMSSASSIFRCRKDNPSSCSNVQIKKPSGSYTGLTYDHNHSNWATKAYNDWGGLVQDSAHGVQPLNLPIGTADPMDLIRRGDTLNPADSSESATLKSNRMYWQADLRILDGVAYDKNGNIVSLPAGAVSTKTLYDYREGKTITVRELNIGNLGSSAPANGILYVSETQNSNNSKAVRLTNGATLPAGGLTVASDDPIYVKGNYNTNSKKGAAIFADAVSFLSNSWKDTTDSTPYNASTELDDRPATSTTVNAAVVTGNTTTSVGSYNGGLENLPRFLEGWSGRTFTYKGSLVDLWQSQQGTGAWKSPGDSNNVYAAPNRVWSYDTDFNNPANLPPGTPRVRTLARAQWVRM